MSDLARTPKQLGNLIRRARKQRGWNQTQLGKKAGLRRARPGSDIFISHCPDANLSIHVLGPVSQDKTIETFGVGLISS